MVAFAVAVLVAMLATLLSGPVATSNRDMNAQDSQLSLTVPTVLLLGSEELEYVVISDANTTHVLADVQLWSNGTVSDRAIEQDGSTQSPSYNESISLPLSSFGLSVSNASSCVSEAQSIEGVPGQVVTTSMIRGNSFGLVSHAMGNAVNSETGFHFHVDVHLLTNGSILGAALSGLRANGTYYWFIPQLINPLHNSALLKDNSMAPTQYKVPGEDPEIFLQQKDNPTVNQNVWHLGVSLSVSSFSPGGNTYSASIDTGSDFGNWAKLSSSLSSTSTHNSNYAEVQSTGHAVYLGWFGQWWQGRPTVTVSESFSFSSYILTVSGSLDDPLYIYEIFWIEYSDYSNSYYNFNYQQVTRYMV